MGGKQKKTTKNTYTPPKWVESNAQLANQIGRRIGTTEHEQYTGDRVAGLSENEQMGVSMARSNVGIGQPYYDKAEMYADRGATSWADADQEKWMNPYIKGALDPAAREIREAGAMGANALDSRASSMDAFGGSRAALMRSENTEKTLQGISDLYGKGYAQAYEWSANQFGQERARDMEAAGRFQQLGGAAIDASQTDISTLMTTGATDRGVQQAMLDFNWQQFVEERDWDFRQLMGVVSALEGTKGSYTTTQTGETVVKKDNTAEVVGAIASIVASAYGSDENLKDNITYLFTGMGRRFYTWTWKPIAIALGIAGPNFGVIAQENPDISTVGPDGFLIVDYPSLFGGDS